jgi:hypothetical protein
MTDTFGVRRCSAALNSRQSIFFANALLRTNAQRSDSISLISSGVR